MLQELNFTQSRNASADILRFNRPRQSLTATGHFLRIEIDRKCQAQDAAKAMIQSTKLLSALTLAVLCHTPSAGITIGPVRVVTFSETLGGTIQRNYLGESIRLTATKSFVRDGPTP